MIGQYSDLILFLASEDRGGLLRILNIETKKKVICL